jgi:tetratricopeptide (TPR) repeat protein
MLSLALLAACAATKPPEPSPPTYDQLMAQAVQAQTAGDNAKAVELWHDAARQNPAAKEPWLRMAQVHFDASDYGNTITEAQEALQRAPNDAVANGLLAVSGLRVSSAALARMHPETLAGSTRTEAQALAKTLRDLVGEPVLVPLPVAAASAPPAPPPRRAVRASRPAVPPAQKQAEASPAAAPRDPFGALR